MKQRNFVAKHLRTFQKHSVEVDKKKEMRKNGGKQDKYWEEEE